MAVSIKIIPKFNNADIKKNLAARQQLIEQVIISRLQFVGEAFVSNARTNGNYRDQTGNLRASIGYVLLKDGKQLSAVIDGKTGSGQQMARKAIRQSGAARMKGFVLICVAGAEYALSVEAKGYDVITGAATGAKSDLEKAIAQLRRKIG